MKQLAVAIALSSAVLAAPLVAQEPAASPDPAAPAEPAPAEVAPPPAAEAEAEAEAATMQIELLSEDELQALGIDASVPVDTSLKLSGFADFGFAATLNDKDSFWRGSGIVPSSPTFYVGNLNVYLDKRLTETIRTLFEVRFTFLPNGSRGFGFEERQDTTASDYIDFGRSTRWGSIIIERAYIEWSPQPWLTIRGGQFLTPYGVWNVDHGSVVVIPVRRPWTLGDTWVPPQQTGLEFYGRAPISDTSTLGYHLTLSNGQGPISEYADLDANKAIGGRLYWELHALGWWRFGGSAYYGRYTDAAYTSAFSGGMVTASERITNQYDQLTWAFDLTWDIGALHVQTEWLFTERAYTTKGRTLRTAEVGTLIPADMATQGGYGLIGYRLPWFGIMPYVVAERVTGGLQDLDVTANIFQVGLNIRPVDELVFKLSYEQLAMEEDLIESLHVISSQVAWAF